MNALTSMPTTMSSLDIAELTGKRHDNVMEDIRKMLEELDFRAPDFSGTQKYGNNNTREIFNLPKRECFILVSGYSITMRTAIIDRWQVLEQQVALPKPEAKRTAKQLASDRLWENKARLSNTKVTVADARAEVLVAKYAAMKVDIEAKHKLTQQALKDKYTKMLAQGLKLKGDMSVGKLSLPKSTITHLLRTHASSIMAVDANYALVALGYLLPDRKTVTEIGSVYGSSNRSGNGNPQQPLWFTSEFGELLPQIETALVSLHVLDDNGNKYA